jgi:hypothetical protein
MAFLCSIKHLHTVNTNYKLEKYRTACDIFVDHREAQFKMNMVVSQVNSKIKSLHPRKDMDVCMYFSLPSTILFIAIIHQFGGSVMGWHPCIKTFMINTLIFL